MLIKRIKFKKIFISLMMIFMFLNINQVKANTLNDWDEWRDENYWEWHTRTTTDDQAYNGKHIEINEDVINFYGYWQNSYKDFLYKEYNKQGKKIFQFRIDESKANYHTLDGAGFIFNASKVEDKLSGYILLFREKDVCLYRIDNVDINTLETASDATINTYGELIQSKPKTNSNIHDLIVEATPTNIKVTEGNSEIINLNLDYSKHSGESFGLISSYVQHACERLSKIEFSEFNIIIEDYVVEVLNTDLEENPISGGYFEIKDEKGQVIKEGKTDENGIITIEEITAGTYTVQQKNPPATYILNDTIYNFKVTSEGKVVDVNSGEQIELIIKNDQLKIEINNHIFNTKNPIAGSKIGLYDNNGKLVMTAITDNKGIATFIGIEEGEYTYKQLEVSEEYELNTNEYKCTVNKSGTVKFDEKDKNVIHNKKIEKKAENAVSNEMDNTISNIPIPKAGQGLKIKGLLIVFVIIFSMGILVKIKRYKDIK